MSTKELPQLIDTYVQAREERLAAQRHTDELKRGETTLMTEIMDLMREQSLSVAGSAFSMVTLRTDDKPVVSDWDSVYQYIQENDAFDLLQRRLGEGAVKARWEDGVDVPGVTTYPVEKLTISKVR